MAPPDDEGTDSGERRRLVTFLTTVIRFISSQARDGGQFAAIADQMEVDRAPLSGLRTVARDFVEWCEDVKRERWPRSNAELEAAGAPFLPAMRRTGYRKILLVLERGRIRTDSEWYLLIGVLSDTADHTLTPAERECAE